MALDPIATGQIRIDVNDAEAVAALRKIDSEFDRAMREIDRKKAEYKIDGDLSGLEDKVKNARREIRKLEGEKAKLPVDADTSDLNKKLKKARKDLKKLDGEKATLELEIKSDEAGKKAALADIKAVEAAQEAADKASARLAKKEAARQKALAKTRTALNKQRIDEEDATAKAVAKTRTALNKQRIEEELAAEKEAHAINDRMRKDAEDQASALAKFRTAMAKQRVEEELDAEKEAWAMRERIIKDEQDALRRLQKTQEALWKQRDREMSEAERDAWRMEQARQREIDSIPRLRAEYAKLAVSIEKMHAARRAARRDPLKAESINLDIGRAEQDMRLIKQRLQDIGENPPVVVEIHPGRRFGENLRYAINQGMQDSGVRGAIHRSGLMAAITWGQAFNEGLRRRTTSQALIGMATAPLAALGRLAKGLQDVTVRIGPFTATLRQAFIGISVLAPVILDVVGALGSLVSVLGSGLAGAAGVGTAALGAFGLIAGATGGIFKSLMSDYKNLGTLEKAWHMQVLKTGENSTKAKKKLKEFNNALGEVGPIARDTFQEMRLLEKEWGALAKKSRPAFFEGFSEWTKTARYGIKQFGDEATESFTLMSKGFQGAMKGLRSDEARKIFQTLFDEGQKAMPAFGRGLGNLAHALGNFAAAFSKMLPSLGGGFERWTQKVEAFTEDTEKMDSFVQRTVQSMRALGQFLKAGGQFLAAFFGQGVEAGESFLGMMTRTLNEWTRMIRAGETPGIKRFFDEGVRGTRALYHLLKPVVASFVRWAEMLAPFVRDMMEGAAAVGGFVGWLLKIGPLNSTLSTVATTLGAIWAFGKISKATRAIQGFTKALWGAKAASTALAATAPATAAASVAAGAAAGAGAGGKRKKKRRGKADDAELDSRAVDLLAATTAAGAGASIGKRMIGTLRGTLTKLGPAGIALGLGSAIMGSVDIIGQRQTFAGKFNALADNIFNTFTLGLTDSAEEKTAAAFEKVKEAITRNADAKIPKNILNDVLTKQQVDLIPSLREASRAAAEFIRTNKLPNFKPKVELGGVNKFKSDLGSITATWGLMQGDAFTTLRSIRAESEHNLKAIAATMGTQSAAGKAAVERNFRLTAAAINRRASEGKISATTAMRAIHSSYVSHSRGSKGAAIANFGAARDAILDAARRGHKTSAEKLAAIHKLWVAALKSYGYTAPQAIALATNPQKGTGTLRGGDKSKPSGGGQTIGNLPSMEARGGLHTVGHKGAVGKDNVPAMFNGEPVMVANGENVAVFNRHQRKALDQRLADEGGLRGFFGRHRKPHYMATGGIVELGRQIQAQGYHVSEHPAFGGVAPGAHSATGWHYKGGALDINADNFPGGEMAALDKLAAWLIGKGWNVLWRVADHFDHLHVDVGKGGGVGGMMPSIEMPKLKRQIAEQGLGVMTALSQRVLDTALGAAQANIEKVHEQAMFADIGEGAVSGAGRFTAASMAALAASVGAAQPRVMGAIGMAESTGNPAAHGPPDGRGLWQIEWPVWGSTMRRAGLTNAYDPQQNARMMKIVQQKQGLSAWVVYNTGAYRRYMARGGLLEAAKGALIGEGSAPEWRVDTKTGKGYKTKGPELAALKPTEAIIPTEKRMRGRAVDIMKNVASDLGFDRFAGGRKPPSGMTSGFNSSGGRKPPNSMTRNFGNDTKTGSTYSGTPYSGATGRAGSYLGERPRRAPARNVKNVNRGSSTFAKRRSKAYKSGRGYVRYIDGLKVAQSDWERELAFRETHVNEPEDLMVEQGRIMVYNPETGKEEDVGPRMVPNVSGIQQYKEGLEWVQDAFTNLIKVIQEIIAAIPLALSAINTEEVYRNANIKNLKRDIDMHERVIEARGRGKVDKKDRDIIKRHEKKKEQAEAELQHEETVLGTLKEDRRTLKADHKEAHWSLREVHPQAEKNRQERAGLDDRVANMVAVANAETTSSGVSGFDGGGAGGAGGADQLTYGQQAVLADTERANVLRAFGNNMASLIGARSGGGMAGGTGPGAINAAMRGGAAGGGGYDNAAGSAVSSSNAASNAAAANGTGGYNAGSSDGYSSSSYGSSGGDRNVTINNTFLTPPPEPHTFVKGMEYESQTAF